MLNLLCVLQDTAGSVAFANDNKTLFYVTKDKLDRPFKVSSVKPSSASVMMDNGQPYEYVTTPLSEHHII